MACPFLREKRKNNVTTVLQPCQVFFNSTQSPSSPQAMEVSINTLSMKVFVWFHTFRVVLLKTKVKHFKPAALFVSINLSLSSFTRKSVALLLSLFYIWHQFKKVSWEKKKIFQPPVWPFVQVSPVIINTVITIQSALSPTAETPEEQDRPVHVDLWEKRGWKELKLWFLEEEGDEDTKSLTPLIPQGESLKVLNEYLFIIIVIFIIKFPMLFILFEVVFFLIQLVVPCLCLSVAAGYHKFNLSDSGGWSGTSHCPHASDQVLLSWRCEKLVHTH